MTVSLLPLYKAVTVTLKGTLETTVDGAVTWRIACPDVPQLKDAKAPRKTIVKVMWRNLLMQCRSIGTEFKAKCVEAPKKRELLRTKRACPLLRATLALPSFGMR